MNYLLNVLIYIHNKPNIFKFNCNPMLFIKIFHNGSKLNLLCK